MRNYLLWRDRSVFTRYNALLSRTTNVMDRRRRWSNSAFRCLHVQLVDVLNFTAAHLTLIGCLGELKHLISRGQFRHFDPSLSRGCGCFGSDKLLSCCYVLSRNDLLCLHHVRLMLPDHMSFLIRSVNIIERLSCRWWQSRRAGHIADAFLRSLVCEFDRDSLAKSLLWTHSWHLVKVIPGQTVTLEAISKDIIIWIAGVSKDTWALNVVVWSTL